MGDFDKIYVLFQFEYSDADYSYFRAEKFKFSKGYERKKKAIEGYFNAILREEKEKIWKLIAENEEFDLSNYETVSNLLSKFENGLIADYEFITKEDYQGWKELSKAGKVSFV